MDNVPKIIVIRTSFKHHSKDSGYKQILKYTLPKRVFGIDENGKEKSNWFLKKYKILFEFKAWFYALFNQIDLVHVMYGEEYFRFTSILFKHKPVVVTFHQPPNILEREVLVGDPMGRVMEISHNLTRTRFKKISAAIVLTIDQKEVLKKVMDESSIHVVPLGFNYKILNQFKKKNNYVRENRILTVGDWQRDWEYYFSFVKYCQKNRPNWHFILINRKLDNSYIKLVEELNNLTFLSDVTDEELYINYLKAKTQFLPFKCATGNNSLNEGLSLGCSVISNYLNDELKSTSFAFEEPLKDLSVENRICEVFNMNEEEYSKISIEASIFASKNDWEEISKKTINLYKELV